MIAILVIHDHCEKFISWEIEHASMLTCCEALNDSQTASVLHTQAFLVSPSLNTYVAGTFQTHSQK